MEAGVSNVDTEQLIRKVVREELKSLLSDMVTNVGYIRGRDHTELTWDGLQAWAEETESDMAKKLDRLESW